MTRPFRPGARWGTATLGAALAATCLTAVSAAPANAAEGATTRVMITARNVVDMPTRLAPGVHRLIVRTVGTSAFQLVRPAAGYSKRDLARDVRIGFEGNVRAFERFERNVDLVGGVNAGTDERGVMWARLKRGTYWAFDTDPARFLASKMLTVHVGGQSVGGSLPTDATLTASGDTAWADDPASIPASGKVTLRNQSGSNHFFGVGRLRPGMTMADVDAWVEGVLNGEEERPPIRFGVGFESGVVGPGQSMTMSYDLPPGEYVMVCFWPMPEHDFMPHMFMGMYRQLSVG